MTSKPMTARCPDYQFFDIDSDGQVCNPGERMKAKLKAIPLPDLKGKKVLDIGCDFGFWTFTASNLGASRVLGLDRGRPVRGEYFDLISSNIHTADQYPKLKNCFFADINIGKEWMDYGQFDVIFMFSLYHHIFENCGDHDSIWFWLWRQSHADTVIIWENPTDVLDGVAYSNISKDKHHLYTEEQILKAASQYFDVEYKGPALHEKTRSVYYFKPKKDRFLHAYRHIGKIEGGAGGATKAFEYQDGRRIKEIDDALGFATFPGSLNMKLTTPFDWGRDYFRSQILDVETRSKGFDSPWVKRWARFYPVMVNQWPAYVMRFEGEENYPLNFVEVISSVRLRDMIKSEEVTLERP